VMFEFHNYKKISCLPFDLNWKRFGGNGKSVEVKKSTVKDAGLGVFALRSFRKGDVITAFIGIKKKRNARKNRYALAISPKYDLCPTSRQIRVISQGDHVAHMINHSFDVANAVLCAVKERNCLVVAVAIQSIPCGSEIFVDYGEEAGREIQNKKTSRKLSSF